MLSFVPTPIGNIEDISYRSAKVIQEAQVFFCEDTRVSKKLLSLIGSRLSIKIDIQNKVFLPINSHTEVGLAKDLLGTILSKKCVFLSDAGMPCISDPGSYLVRFCQEKNIKYDFLPGASAGNLAFAMSGFEEKEFIFFGFLHNTNPKRSQDLEKILGFAYPTIIYESPKRVQDLINEIAKKDPNRIIFIAKELTKMHEFYTKNTALKLTQTLQDLDLRGEWCLVISANKIPLDLDLMQAKVMELDLKPKEKVKLLAKLSDKTANQWYKELFDKN